MRGTLEKIAVELGLVEGFSGFGGDSPEREKKSWISRLFGAKEHQTKSKKGSDRLLLD
jgi:hypothetical protein